MRRLVFLVYFLSFSIWAQERPIEEMSNGACWIQEAEEGYWKVAGFTEGKTYEIGPHNVFDGLADAVHVGMEQAGIREFPKSHYDVSVQCNGTGLDIMVSVVNREIFSLCMKGALSAQGFSISNVYSNPEHQQGICERVIPGRLLISPNKGIALAELMSTLQSAEYESMIRHVSSIGSILVVELSPDFRFRESMAKERLLQSQELRPLIRSIDYSSVLFIPGDAKVLKSGTLAPF